MSGWLAIVPIWLLGILLLALMLASGYCGVVLRRRRKSEDAGETQEGYVVSAVLSLLALLIGFTFALAVDRYEARRQLVIDDAAAIETLYLRAQLLGEPHRSRFSRLLIRYTDNHLALAQAEGAEEAPLLAENQRLIADLWTATAPAFDTIRGIDFSSSFVDSVNQVIALDVARKAARKAQIPAGILFVLYVYSIVSALMLGYVLKGRQGRIAGAFLLALFTLSLALLSDINQPLTGTIRESQAPMERLRETLRASPPALFDRLRPPAAAATPTN